MNEVIRILQKELGFCKRQLMLNAKCEARDGQTRNSMFKRISHERKSKQLERAILILKEVKDE